MKSTKEKDKEQSKSKMSVCIFVFPVLFLLFSFFAPAIFTRNIPLLSYIPWVNEVCFNEKTGVIGDTFGIMNPFIAIAAAVITGLAFWEQYKANQQLKDDNAKQQVERQFYEMLKIHRDNVAEFITRREDKEIRGQRAVKYFLKDFLKIYDKVSTVIEANQKDLDDNSKLSQDKIELAYLIFFEAEDCESVIKDSHIKELLKKFKESDEYKNLELINHKEILNGYFRHLYLMVKSVANSKIFGSVK